MTCQSLTRAISLAIWCSLGLFGCVTRAPLPLPKQPLVATPRVDVLERRPELQPEEVRNLPQIKAFSLANGLRLYVLESHAFPHVAATFVNLRGGECEQDLDHAGLPSLVTETLLASVDRREQLPSSSAANAAQPMDPLITFAGDTLRHTAVFSTLVESRKLGEAVRAMAQLVREPLLDDTTLALARKRARAAWDDQRYNVAGVAHNHITQRLYGPLHVLGQHADMATKRLDDHPIARVKVGYQARYVPGASAVILVGDVDAAAANLLTNQHFGDWRVDAKAPLAYAPSDWQPRGKRKIFLHTRARVAHITVGQRAPSPSDPDYVATQVVAHLLGGSFSSRLMTRLRGQAGLTYSANSSLYPRRDGSLLTIETMVERDAAEQALGLMLNELERMKDGLATDEELRRVTSSLRQAELARYERTSSAVAALAGALELGQDPVTQSQKYLDALQTLSTADLREAAKRVLDRRAPIVIVGDLRSLGDLGQWADSDDEKL